MSDGAKVSRAVEAGDLIDGRYRIQSLLGRGGMSEVYSATDETLHRTVAVKLFHRDAADPVDMERAATEVKLLASLSHHALVTVFDARVATTSESGYAYLTMELVDGEDLRTRIERGPVAHDDAAAMLCDLAEALHVVHSHGVVHRDIKPANVLLRASPLPDREFSVKLADFGIAHLTDSIGLTATGAVIGTAAYLSPEQATGDGSGPASDIYSLGLVILEALTGVRAFPGSMVESVSARLVSDPPIPDSLDQDWQTLLRSMTVRDPGQRPVALDVTLAAHSLNKRSPSHSSVQGESANQDTMPLDQIGVPTVPMQRSDFDTAGARVPGSPDGSDSPTVRLDLQEPRGAVPPSTSTLTRETVTANAVTADNNTLDQSGFASDRRQGQFRRWLAIVAIILGVLVLATVTVVLWSMLSSGTSSPPALPAIDDPLGTHLHELMKSVTP